MRFVLARTLRAASLTGALVALAARPGAAQLGDPTGPGQAVPPPPPQCPETIACTYMEHNALGPGGYRFQMLRVCGANCSVQYWVTNAPDGRLLLGIEPVRGGGIVAVGRATSPNDAYPPVRTILPDYAPTDAMCCPSGFKDTTYTWDAAQGTLVAGTPTVIPASSFPGWERLRQQLQQEEFFDVFAD